MIKKIVVTSDIDPSKSIRAEYTEEVAQELEVTFNIDVEEELTKILKEEMRKEGLPI